MNNIKSQEQNKSQDIAETLRKLAITKQLNFLIGSGTSVPAIPLMKDFTKYGEFANDYLLKRVKAVSKLLEYDKHQNGKISKSQIGQYTYNVLISYEKFIGAIIDILNISNSRQTPKNSNIFTTNYDLFLEKAVSTVSKNKRFIFNDGASGYFSRVIDSTNYNRVVAYKGLNDNYISEIPSLNLIKSHGSVNWERKDEVVLVENKVVNSPMIVKPTGLESQETFLNNHFHEMLRTFQIELDKPQSVLFVIGFSFQDKHIAKMVKRAIQNPELMIYIFSYSRENKDYLKKLEMTNEPLNLKILTPDKFDNKFRTVNEDPVTKETWYSFTLDNLTDILIGESLEE